MISFRRTALYKNIQRYQYLKGKLFSFFFTVLVILVVNFLTIQLSYSNHHILSAAKILMQKTLKIFINTRFKKLRFNTTFLKYLSAYNRFFKSGQNKKTHPILNVQSFHYCKNGMSSFKKNISPHRRGRFYDNDDVTRRGSGC